MSDSDGKRTVEEKDDSAFRELDRLEKSERIKWKYRSLGYLTISMCIIALGSAASLMYAYVNNDRDFEEGAFGSVINLFIEIFKIIIGAN